MSLEMGPVGVLEAHDQKARETIARLEGELRVAVMQLDRYAHTLEQVVEAVRRFGIEIPEVAEGEAEQ